MSRRLFDLLPHLIIAVQVEHVSDEVECILIPLHVCIEPRQIEPVRQVLFVDFAEVLVASGRNELG